MEVFTIPLGIRPTKRLAKLRVSVLNTRVTLEARYVHTNLIARDWKRLAAFYTDVFGCVPVPPERNLNGPWLDDATGLSNARLEGVHLRLPGYGDRGPTLEIFSYRTLDEASPSPANRRGYGHLAFAVDDVSKALEVVLNHGGSRLGLVVEHEVPLTGRLTFTYCRDPESNVIELQNWRAVP